jgi:phosphate starvation-inducible membrane PsiE
MECDALWVLILCSLSSLLPHALESCQWQMQSFLCLDFIHYVISNLKNSKLSLQGLALSPFPLKHTAICGFWTKLMYVHTSVSLEEVWNGISIGQYFVKFNGIKLVPSNNWHVNLRFCVCCGWAWLFQGIICDMETAFLLACNQDVDSCINHQCGVKIKI